MTCEKDYSRAEKGLARSHQIDRHESHFAHSLDRIGQHIKPLFDSFSLTQLP